MDKCLDCGREFDTPAGLHIHIASRHDSVQSYYHNHFPRYCKLTGDLLPYKDKASYMTADFASRNNQITWLMTSTDDEVKAYVVQYWRARKSRKGLVYAPAQVEMRSLDMPGKKTLTRLFGDHNQVFDTLGLKRRFSQDIFLLPPADISKQMIIVDTREQQPLEFGQRTRNAALGFGDYRLSNNTVSEHCYIERKSVMDFHGSVCKDYARFSREINRAVSAGAYLIVLVEGTIEDVHKFSGSRFFSNKPLSEARQTRSVTSASSIFSKMRELLMLYPENLQFLFVKDRQTSAQVIQRLFASGGEYKKVDLQYAYDTGNLCGTNPLNT